MGSRVRPFGVDVVDDIRPGRMGIDEKSPHARSAHVLQFEAPSHDVRVGEDELDTGVPAAAIQQYVLAVIQGFQEFVGFPLVVESHVSDFSGDELAVASVAVYYS